MNAPSRRLSPVARKVWRVRQGLLWLALVVAGVVVSFQVDALGPLWWLVPLVGLAVCTTALPALRWARWRWDIGDEGIDIQHGTLTVRRTLVPWVRVQHVDTRRDLFEQAFGLANVVVHTAAGSHTIPLLAVDDAERLRTRIAGLARAEEEGAAAGDEGAAAGRDDAGAAGGDEGASTARDDAGAAAGDEGAATARDDAGAAAGDEGTASGDDPAARGDDAPAAPPDDDGPATVDDAAERR